MYLAWDFRIGVGKADIFQYNATCFLSLHCMSKPFHTQVDSLPDEGNSEYTLPVGLLNDLCLCTTARAQCDIAHLIKYCASQCHMKNHMPRIWLVVQDPELSSQQNQGMAWSVPDPFPSLRVGSGNETACKVHSIALKPMGVSKCTPQTLVNFSLTLSEFQWVLMYFTTCSDAWWQTL